MGVDKDRERRSRNSALSAGKAPEPASPKARSEPDADKEGQADDEAETMIEAFEQEGAGIAAKE